MQSNRSYAHCNYQIASLNFSISIINGAYIIKAQVDVHVYYRCNYAWQGLHCLNAQYAKMQQKLDKYSDKHIWLDLKFNEIFSRYITTYLKL